MAQRARRERMGPMRCPNRGVLHFVPQRPTNKAEVLGPVPARAVRAEERVGTRIRGWAGGTEFREFLRRTSRRPTSAREGAQLKTAPKDPTETLARPASPARAQVRFLRMATQSRF